MMWTRYAVRWEFLTRLCASTPGESQLVRAWLESRKPSTKPPDAKSIDEIAAEVMETIPEEPEPKGLVFQRKDGVLVMRAATVRAHLKDCARVMSSLYVGKIEGEKSFAVRVTNSVYWPVESYWIPILNRETGKAVTAPSGVIERPGHPMGRTGPQATIKVFEYVEDAVMEFPLLVLTRPERVSGGKTVPGAPVISEADLRKVMLYGGVHGYGGERSLDGGRYAFTIKLEGPEGPEEDV